MKIELLDNLDTYKGLSPANKDTNTVYVIKDRNIAFAYNQDDKTWISYFNTVSGFSDGTVAAYLDPRLRKVYNHCWGIYSSGDFFTCDSYASKEKTSLAQIKKLKKILENFELPKTTGVQLGVELELESDSNPDKTINPKARRGKLQDYLYKVMGNLINSVVYDGSVRGGTEIRFGHGTIEDWSNTQMTRIMRHLKRMRFNHKTGTAGMHIHMSLDDETATKRAAAHCLENSDAVREILYPICARPAKIHGTYKAEANRYGLGDNYTRGFTRHKTLEIRVWEATTNPDVFLGRIKFADYFIRFLGEGLPMAEFFERMTLADKENYKFLVETENPHAFGIGKDAALAKLNMGA